MTQSFSALGRDFLIFLRNFASLQTIETTKRLQPERYRDYLIVLARASLRALALLQNKIDASDIVQEVLLQGHLALPQYKGTTEAELTTWLRKILATRMSNAIRHFTHAQRRDVNREREFGQALDRSSQALQRVLALSQTSPSERAARREHAVILADAIERLPNDYRDVIILHHLQGLTFPEVAQAMDRSPGSVEKLWARALVKLRGQLEDAR